MPQSLETKNSADIRPWYKKAWFISLSVIIILWFGLPLILKLFESEVPQSDFTNLPDITAELTNVPLSSIETADDPWLGSPIAPVVIVEFGDFECPFCRQAAPVIKDLLTLYPEAVKFIYRDFPVSAIHAQALPAAESANCAFRQEGKAAFWKFHDALYDRQDDLGADLYLALVDSLNLDRGVFEKCLSQHLTLAEIQKDLNDGLAAGVVGTPTWFVNGRKFEGVLSLEVWRKIIDYTLVNQFKVTD